MCTSSNVGFEIAKHPQIMNKIDYFNLRQTLNTEQQMIVKDIIIKKQKDRATPIHLFLTGGAGTGKTFTTKAIYYGLLRLYSNEINGYMNIGHKFILLTPNNFGLISAYIMIILCY